MVTINSEKVLNMLGWFRDSDFYWNNPSKKMHGRVFVGIEHSLNELAEVVHKANIKWWQDIDTGAPIERNSDELLCLVVSELSECLEGERKDLMDDKLPHRKMAEVEMADAYIRLLDFAAGYKYDLNTPESSEVQPVILPIIDNNKGAAILQVIRAVLRIGDNTVPVWLYIVLRWIEAYCDKFGYDLWGALGEKMEFNAQREDHTHEARRIAGGKQF